MTDKKEEIDFKAILVMLAKHYQDTKERYFDRHLKTCSVSNPNRRELTVFEQSEWQSFPLVQGTKLQNIVEKIATDPNYLTEYADSQAKEMVIRFAEWIFKECDTTHGQFPHDSCGFWHKETQKYYTLIELYDLFEIFTKQK